MGKNDAPWDDWLEDNADDDLLDLEESVIDGSWEWDHRREYVYPSEEVAWLEYFTVDNLGSVFQATCSSEGETFVRSTRGKAIDAVRIHVERGHRSPDNAPHTYIAFNGEPPF
jgi:hypothetical protein